MNNISTINSMTTVLDIMTNATDVISVFPDTSLIDAAKIIAEHNFDGVPVVNENHILLGILTEYDLVSKGSLIHLPTFQLILQNLHVFKKDQNQFQKEIDMLSALKVRDVMNSDPLTLSEDATYEDVVKTFSEHHRVNPIPIINKEKKIVGVVSRFDVLKPLHSIKK